MELINGTADLHTPASGAGSDAPSFVMTVTETVDHDGYQWLVFVAKARYLIPTDPAVTPKLAGQQSDLLVSDEFVAKDGLSAPLVESDFAPAKRACDVIVRGSAYCPDDKPHTELQVGLSVGDMTKMVNIVGDRQWRRRLGMLSLSQPEPFVKMPIHYGMAFGGSSDCEGIEADDHFAHPGNLFGCGYAPKDHAGVEGMKAPNLEYPDDPITSPHKLHRPAALGPLGRSWMPRRQYAGTYDQKWMDEVFPLPPDDLDLRFYQCAPEDQQIDYPSGGEDVVLFNLTPGGGARRFQLPDLSLPVVMLTKERKQHPIEAKVDTLLFDTERESFEVVWRGRTKIRSLHDVHTVAAGKVCKRWWKSRVFGTSDCGCGGLETADEDMSPVTEALFD